MGYYRCILRAVHYVNAYLWETYDFAPANHRDRTIAVYHDATLASVATCYDLLRDSAYAARYHPTFRASNDLLQDAMRCLEQNRSLVLSEFDR